MPLSRQPSPERKRHVPDVGTHVVEDAAGWTSSRRGSLQVPAHRCRAIILIHLHVQQDGETSQVTTRHLDLGQPGRGGIIQTAADGPASGLIR